MNQTLRSPTNRYVFFSNNTTGKCGVPVKIDINLFMDFCCAIDSSNDTGKQIIREIENLRTNPATNKQQFSPQSYIKDNGAPVYAGVLRDVYKKMNLMHEGKVETRNIAVYFHIHQIPNDDKVPTVYISDLKVKAGNDKEFGLFEEKTVGFRNNLTKKKNRNVNNKTVFISGSYKSKEEALSEALAVTDTNKKDLTLYYNPSSVKEDLSIWKKNKISNTTRATIEELKKVISENQKNTVNWIAESEGAAVLYQAIEKTPLKLDKHTFRLISPKTNTPRLLEQLKSKKAQFSNNILNYGGDKASSYALASHSELLKEQIRKTNSNSDYDPIGRRYLVGAISQMSQAWNRKGNALSQRESLSVASITFVDALRRIGKLL